MNVLEIIVEFVRDVDRRSRTSAASGCDAWTPLLLTLFVFILGANVIGLIPIFDVLALLNHTVLHLPEDSFLAQVLHGGVDRDRQLQRHGGAGDDHVLRDHHRRHRARTASSSTGRTWCRTGCRWPIYFLLIPIEIMGMFVRPFALTMRLAANMTGGHIAILAILSFVFIFTELFGRRSPASASARALAAARRRHLGARDHRRARSGLRVHALDGRVHRHGHSRSSLSYSVRWTANEGEDEWKVFALAYMGAGIGLGLAVIGAGLGIGQLAAGAAEGIGRQPSATAQITGAVNLPLFLLEGVAILAEVFALLIVLLK